MGLTEDQQTALDCCMSGKNVFITGGGGVGKTYLIHKVVDCLKEAGRAVMLTASTGRAAQLIGGSTCHRAFRIPLKMAWNKDPRPGDIDNVCAADTVIIDEISMVRMDVFGYIVRCLRRADMIRKKNGKPPVQLIVVGDFCQLPPVMVVPKDGSPGDADLMEKHYGFDIGGGFAFSAPEWNACEFVVCDLREVVRQTDKATISAFTRLRYNDKSVLSEIKKATRKKPYPPEEKNVVYLCGKNKTADKINRDALDRLPGPGRTYKSTIEGTVSAQDKPSPDSLHLRVGAHVMMLQNTDTYVNGSTGTVTYLGEDYVCVTLNDDDHTEVTVREACWEVTTYEKDTKGSIKLVVIGRYYQLPLRLAYAVTIHRSQGQTLTKAVLCIGKNGSEIFASGQLYVGISRITDLRNLYIKGNLSSVDQLASNEVLEFYRSIGIDTHVPAPVGSNAAPAPPALPKQKKSSRPQPHKGTAAPAVIEKDRDPAPQKQAEKKRTRISVTAFQRPVIIAFAQVLDPEAYTDGSAVVVAEGCADAVKDFLAKI